MAKLVLSTGLVPPPVPVNPPLAYLSLANWILTSNVSAGGPLIIRKAGSTTRSNLELINALRDHFAVARQDYAADVPTSNGSHKPVTPPLAPLDAWTERQGTTWYIPRIWGAACLSEEASQYEITVKLFLLPDAPFDEREQYAREALALVRKELGVPAIDLLVISFPEMSFEGSCEWEADKINAQQGNLEEQLATWAKFEELQRQGIVKRLGVAEFGSERLGEFINRTTICPVVDQINLRDCCNVPPPLKKLAEDKGIELNVHTDCTDILPRGTLQELLGHGPQGAGMLPDNGRGGAGLPAETWPLWVARYVAFVRDRGVIENKGYFAGAKLAEG